MIKKKMMTRQDRDIKWTELRTATKLAFRNFMKNPTRDNKNKYDAIKLERNNFKLI